MSFRTLFLTVGASLAIHAAVGYSLYFPWASSNFAPQEPILISYMKPQAVKQEKPLAAPVPAVKINSSQKILEKRIQRIPKENTPADAWTALSAKLSAVPPAKGSAAADASFTAPSKPKTSAEFLADPKRNKIFVGYFGRVKEKIHEVLREQYNRESQSSGRVSLSFVLAADGRLQKILINEKETRADAFLRNLAARCLKEASPFAAFPRDLDSRQIAFSLIIYFDEI